MPQNHSACLVVGVAAYQSINPLPPTVTNDAKMVYALLTDPQISTHSPGNALLLVDKQATAQAIRQALKNLVERTGPESTVFIYFSGHGFRIPTGKNRDAYLLPVDATYGSEEELVRTSIAGTEFTETLRALPARKVVVVFDCCHAGGIGQPKNLVTTGIKAGLPDDYYQRLASGHGRVIMASSRETEYSWVLPNDTNSLFTKHLLDGLRGEAASSDGFVHIFNLYEYIQPKVTADQSLQHPVFKAEIEENFPIIISSTHLGNGDKAKAFESQQNEYEFDAYVSYFDKKPDADWVWNSFLPKLESAGLKLAVSGDVETPGVARVINIERGIRKARRTLVVMSDAYLQDHGAEFENTLAQTMSVQEGNNRVIPIYHENINQTLLPIRLGMLSGINLAHQQRSEREFQRLLTALQMPL